MRDNPTYCRRTTEQADGTERICNKRIDRVNAMNWCAECRKEHLPFWPAGDPEPAPPTKSGGAAITCALLAMVFMASGCATDRARAFVRGFGQGAWLAMTQRPLTDSQEKDAHFRAYWDMKCDELRKTAKEGGYTEEDLVRRAPLFRGDGLCVAQVSK